MTENTTSHAMVKIGSHSQDPKWDACLLPSFLRTVRMVVVEVGGRIRESLCMWLRKFNKRLNSQ
jgi:hypothetical protein